MAWDIVVERMACKVEAVAGDVIDQREYRVRMPDKRLEHRNFSGKMSPEQAERIGRQYLEAAEKARAQKKELIDVVGS